MPLFCRKILFQTSEKIKVSHSGNPSCNRIFKSNHQVRCTIRSTIEEVWIFVLMINLSFAWYQSEFLVTDYSCLIRADNKKHTLSFFFFLFFLPPELNIHIHHWPKRMIVVGGQLIFLTNSTTLHVGFNGRTSSSLKKKITRVSPRVIKIFIF